MAYSYGNGYERLKVRPEAFEWTCKVPVYEASVSVVRFIASMTEYRME